MGRVHSYRLIYPRILDQGSLKASSIVHFRRLAITLRLSERAIPKERSLASRFSPRKDDLEVRVRTPEDLLTASAR